MDGRSGVVSGEEGTEIDFGVFGDSGDGRRAFLLDLIDALK